METLLSSENSLPQSREKIKKILDIFLLGQLMLFEKAGG